MADVLGQGRNLLDKAGEAARDAKQFAVRKAHDVRAVAEQKTDEVERFLRRHPVESVVVGAACGYLLGWLASRAMMRRRPAPRRRRTTYEVRLERANRI
jgi:ElaB/YqjD/DUF883 family membrane-anchored ribosome-binding protein